MFIGIILLAGSIWLNIATMPPKLDTPQQLAEWAKCRPSKVADYIDRRIEYWKQGDAWDSGELCMRRGKGDCKCKAVVARDALLRCAGYEARVAIVKGQGKRHAVALYTAPAGRRGYINDSDTASYAPGTPWQEIVDDVSGGPWRIEHD